MCRLVSHSWAVIETPQAVCVCMLLLYGTLDKEYLQVPLRPSLIISLWQSVTVDWWQYWLFIHWEVPSSTFPITQPHYCSKWDRTNSNHTNKLNTSVTVCRVIMLPLEHWLGSSIKLNRRNRWWIMFIVVNYNAIHVKYLMNKVMVSW